MTTGATGAPAAGMFGALANLKIKTKLAVGFLVVLGLLGTVGVISTTGFGGARNAFGTYSRIAHNALNGAAVDARMALLRRRASAYLLDGSQEAAGALRDTLAATRKEIQDLHDGIGDPARRATLDPISGQLDAYGAAFDKVVALHTELVANTNEVRTVGGKVVDALHQLGAAAYSSRNPDLMMAVGNAQEALLSARLNAAQYVTTPTPALLDGVKKNLAKAIDTVDKLTPGLASDDQRKLAGAARDGLKAYSDLFSRRIEILNASKDLVEGTMSKIATSVTDTLHELRRLETEELGTIETRTSASLTSKADWAIYLSVGAFLLGLGMAWLLGRAIAGPVVAMTGAMQKLAAGDKDVAVPAQGRRDEIGQMAGAVEIFKQNMIEADRLRGEQEAAKSRSEADKRAAMDKMADEFESSVRGIVTRVSTAASGLQTTAKSMSATAEETQQQATAVAAAAEQASTNVQTVATAAEELSASIGEIGRQVSESARIAGQAVEDAGRTNAEVQALAEAAQKIGDVVKLINDIAGQTNLLALNATIEAARAGEAGKGFAVVASEVKSLATQTAKATEDIAAQIKAIQGATGSAVQAIQGIGGTIGRINEIATTIASAVEEQGAATKEIARNVQQASAGTDEVSANIAKVTGAATETGAAAGQVLGAAGELSRESDSLRTQVDAFVARIRAA